LPCLGITLLVSLSLSILYRIRKRKVNYAGSKTPEYLAKYSLHQLRKYWLGDPPPGEKEVLERIWRVTDHPREGPCSKLKFQVSKFESNCFCQERV